MRPPSDEPILDAELEALIAETRPEPRDGWAEELDARVAEGFPQPKRRLPRIAMPPMRRLIAPGLAVTATALVIGAVVTSFVDRDDAGPGDSGTSSELQRSQDGAAESPSSSAATGGAGERSDDDVAPNERRRAVERAATLTLAAPADEIEEVADEVVRATDGVRGIVVEADITTGDDNTGVARFELRVPVDKLDEALAALSELAHVTARTQSSDDVTRAVVDARERLEDAEAERRALLRALGRADNAAEARTIRSRLRLVASEIASARVAVRQLGQRTGYSRLDVTVDAERDSDGSWTPAEAADDAVRILETVAAVLLVVAAVALPIALFALLAAFAARTTRRRRREAALDDAI
jgi:Domain of unknown function (DUF4349)